ncbi:hypothetical protein Tco_1436576, partial [Tanacetum coccineum]
ASEGLKHQMFDISLAGLQNVEDHSYRKIRSRAEDVTGKNMLTNFWVCYFKGNGVVMTRGYGEHGQLGLGVTKADYRKRLQWHGSVARTNKVKVVMKDAFDIKVV